MQEQNSAVVRSVVVWVAGLLALTVAAALWVDATGGDYRTLSAGSILIAYSPGLVAVIVACAMPRAGGVRLLLRQFRRWRVGAGWYAAALAGPLVLVLAATGVFVLMGGEAPDRWLVLPSLAAIPALLGPIIAGSLGEELGWRGFAQRRLQSRWGMLTAALVVGTLWSCWHLWPLLTPAGATSISAVDVLQTFVRLISTSVVYAWLYNRTNGSLPIVMVAHAGHNIAIDLMPSSVIGTDRGALIVAGLYLATAVTVVVADRPAVAQRFPAPFAPQGSRAERIGP